jgi:hypothetical protein
LLAAVKDDYIEVVKAPIEANAEINARSDAASALGVTAANGNISIVEKLVRASASTDFDDYSSCVRVYVQLHISIASIRLSLLTFEDISLAKEIHF